MLGFSDLEHVSLMQPQAARAAAGIARFSRQSVNFAAHAAGPARPWCEAQPTCRSACTKAASRVQGVLRRRQEGRAPQRFCAAQRPLCEEVCVGQEGQLRHRRHTTAFLVNSSVLPV